MVPAGSLSHFPNHPPIELSGCWGYQSLFLVCSSIHPPTSCISIIFNHSLFSSSLPFQYWNHVVASCLLAIKWDRLELYLMLDIYHTVYKSFNLDCIARLVSFKRNTRDSGTHSSHLSNSSSSLAYPCSRYHSHTPNIDIRVFPALVVNIIASTLNVGIVVEPFTAQDLDCYCQHGLVDNSPSCHLPLLHR